MKKEIKKASKLAIFEGKQIRRHWDAEKELWYFSVSDVIATLTNSVNPLAYWRKLKERLLKEGGNETVTKCHALKMVAADGKMRFTDALAERRAVQALAGARWIRKAGRNSRSGAGN